MGRTGKLLQRQQEKRTSGFCQHVAQVVETRPIHATGFRVEVLCRKCGKPLPPPEVERRRMETR